MAVRLFTTFFFLYDGQNIFKWHDLLPVPARPVATGAALKGWTTLVQYVRVQILVAAVDAIGIGIGAAFLGIPLVIPMTVLVFLTSFVPVVGAIASGAVAVLVALVSNGLISAVIMLAVVIAVQQIESQVLQPFLMGKAVSVHPLAVILAVTGGGFLFGIVGALFAVPLVAVLNSVVSYIVRTNAGDGDAEEDPPRDPDEREATAVPESAKERLNDAVHESAEDERIGRPNDSGQTDFGGTQQLEGDPEARFWPNGRRVSPEPRRPVNRQVGGCEIAPAHFGLVLDQPVKASTESTLTSIVLPFGASYEVLSPALTPRTAAPSGDFSRRRYQSLRRSRGCPAGTACCCRRQLR